MRTFPQPWWCLTVLTLLPTVTPAAGEPLDVGGRRQVFIDERFLTAASGVTLQVHAPVKSEEVTLDADHPDQTLIDRHGTVLLVDGVYRMWYASFAKNRDSWTDGGQHSATESFPLTAYPCYAESKDGIRWTKPDLGVKPPYAGAERNIVPVVDENGQALDIDGIGMVFVDPNAPADARFRMVDHFRDRAAKQDWLDILSSPDGRHWRRTHKNVLNYRSEKHQLDSPNVILWDDRLNRYVAYVRRNLREPGNQGRTVARSESADLAHFPQVEDSPPVLKWDALDPHGVNADGHNVALVDFYNSAVIKYPDAQDAYYAFPAAYYHYVGGVLSVFGKNVPTNAGTTDIQFAASRDGIHWERFDRRPFVPTGRRGSWDSMLLYMFRGVVPAPDGQEMYLYYTGSDRCHGWDRDLRNQELLRAAGLAPTQVVSRVSRVTLRRDGFVSVHAAYDGGQFMTPLLTFNGGELVLNVDTSAVGQVRVEIIGADGVAVPGFTLMQSDPIHSTNMINRRVTWNGKADVSALVGKPVRVRFVMNDSDLYAFQFRSPTGK